VTGALAALLILFDVCVVLACWQVSPPAAALGLAAYVGLLLLRSRRRSA
jgi:hypothetical protein